MHIFRIHSIIFFVVFSSVLKSQNNFFTYQIYEMKQKKNTSEIHHSIFNNFFMKNFNEEKIFQIKK